MGVADRVVLDVANRRRLGADLSDAVISVERVGSLEGDQAFPSITVTVDDPRDRLMESNVLVRPTKRALGTADARALRPVDVLLDGVWYRLRQASRQADTVALKFNHRGVVYMAQHDTPMSASRNDETRAQFIRRQVLEAGRKRGAGHKLAFWAYELRRRMPIAPKGDEASGRSEPERDAGDTTTRASSGKGLTVKGAPMNAAQRSRAARIIKVQDELDAPTKARVAQFCAAIGESRLGEDTGGRGTTFQTTVIPESDLEGQARAFLKGGRSFKAGGAIALAKQAGLTPGDIASQTEVSDKGGAFYNRWKGEAEAILEGMGGASGDAASGEAGSYVKPYRFRRPRGEDGWANTGKLAEEVKKRRFVTIPQRGSDLFVYAADRDLLRLRSQAVIDLDAAYVVGGAEYDLDYGKTVRGMRLTVAGDPFDADFAWGLPVTVEGGPGGKWIVWEVHEVDGSPVVELDLRQPQAQAPEPRPETVQRNAAGQADLSDVSGGDLSGAASQGAKAFVDAAADLANQAGGESVYVGSDYRPGSTTSSGNTSDHASNDSQRAARDIGKRGVDLIVGPPSPELDRAVVAIGRSLGRSYGSGTQRIVDTFQWQGLRVQIIWRTPEYGGHMGHIHIGARRGG